MLMEIITNFIILLQGAMHYFLWAVFCFIIVSPLFGINLIKRIIELEEDKDKHD